MVYILLFSILSTAAVLRGVIFDDEPCDCGCCIVTRRPVPDHTTSMCALDPKTTCSNTCKTTEDTVMAKNASVDTQQFCFYNCRVPAPETAYGEECDDLTHEQKRKIHKIGKDGVDLEKVDEEVENNISTFVKDDTGHFVRDKKGDPVKIDVSKRFNIAKTAENKSKELARDTNKVFKDIEDAHKEVLNMKITNEDHLKIIARLKTLVDQLRTSIAISRANTDITLKEIEAIPGIAVANALKNGIEYMTTKVDTAEARAQKVATMYDKPKPPPPGNPKVAAAGAAAAAPYNRGAAQLGAHQLLFSRQAQELGEQAKVLQDSAVKYAQMAVYYTDPKVADHMREMAKDMLKQSDEIAAKAQQYQATAVGYGNTIPQWQYSGIIANTYGGAYYSNQKAQHEYFYGRFQKK